MLKIWGLASIEYAVVGFSSLLLFVSLEMLSKMRPPWKSVAAISTLVRFLPLVESLVSCQFLNSWKHLVASRLNTIVWLQLTVTSKMLLQVGVLAEEYVTLHAFVRSVDRVVHFLMIQEQFWTFELLLAMTYVAFEIHRWDALVNLGCVIERFFEEVFCFGQLTSKCGIISRLVPRIFELQFRFPWSRRNRCWHPLI